jgi:tetratricopeptide (TPR) repeat protein
MTQAQEEDKEREREERARKALEQRCEEVLSRVAANLAAEKEKIRTAEVLAAELAQALSEMEALDAADPCFAQALTLDPVDTNRSPTPLGPVGDEDDPVSEDPSERDPKAVYTEDENREGALQ